MPLLKLFLDICLFRSGPQEVPAAPFLAVLALAAYVVSGVVVLAPSEGAWRATGQSLLDAAIMLGLLKLALEWRRHPARFVQTTSALAGTGTLLGLLLAPVLALGAQGDGLADLAVLLWMGLFVWSIGVTGHILRHALGLPLAGGILAAVVYVTVALSATNLVFPRAAP